LPDADYSLLCHADRTLHGHSLLAGPLTPESSHLITPLTGTVEMPLKSLVFDERHRGMLIYVILRSAELPYYHSWSLPPKNKICNTFPQNASLIARRTASRG
jgi:hypothetical protein